MDIFKQHPCPACGANGNAAHAVIVNLHVCRLGGLDNVIERLCPEHRELFKGVGDMIGEELLKVSS